MTQNDLAPGDTGHVRPLSARRPADQHRAERGRLALRRRRGAINFVVSPINRSGRRSTSNIRQRDCGAGAAPGDPEARRAGASVAFSGTIDIFGEDCWGRPGWRTKWCPRMRPCSTPLARSASWSGPRRAVLLARPLLLLPAPRAAPSPRPGRVRRQSERAASRPEGRWRRSRRTIASDQSRTIPSASKFATGGPRARKCPCVSPRWKLVSIPITSCRHTLSPSHPFNIGVSFFGLLAE
jgi:hypothetical protein